jgi:hypothetical protein
MPRSMVLGAALMWIALPMARRPQARQEKEVDICYGSE